MKPKYYPPSPERARRLRIAKEREREHRKKVRRMIEQGAKLRELDK